MYRDPGYYWLSVVIYIAFGLGFGTVFCDIGSGDSSIQARGSMLMFVASFLTIMAIGGFASFVKDLKVFERERLDGHYRTSAFALHNTLSSMLFSLIISLVPRAITYYLAGLQSSLGHSVYFASTLLACREQAKTLASSGWIRKNRGCDAKASPLCVGLPEELSWIGARCREVGRHGGGQYGVESSGTATGLAVWGSQPRCQQEKLCKICNTVSRS
ncbi:hypothetical protein NL676_023888 [Syzygium grande]|nr:hypothetical protein NL676_023888 [Syzygium grande]